MRFLPWSVFTLKEVGDIKSGENAKKSTTKSGLSPKGLRLLILRTLATFRRTLQKRLIPLFDYSFGLFHYDLNNVVPNFASTICFEADTLVLMF